MFEFGIKDVIDIVLVAVLLFNAWKLMRSSGSLNVFYGIMVFFIIWPKCPNWANFMPMLRTRPAPSIRMIVGQPQAMELTF